MVAAAVEEDPAGPPMEDPAVTPVDKAEKGPRAGEAQSPPAAADPAEIQVAQVEWKLMNVATICRPTSTSKTTTPLSK